MSEKKIAWNFQKTCKTKFNTVKSEKSFFVFNVFLLGGGEFLPRTRFIKNDVICNEAFPNVDHGCLWIVMITSVVLNIECYFVF